ncbi:MAG: PEP-CTERM sorting domain-containing protein [Pirellulales bacterium]|nr:PEP-CTERM sorting domain-containing protein [Pirellulales bacterium]
MFFVKKSLVVLAVVGTLMFLAAPAVADWDEGDMHKMHYPQLPDLTNTGLDVKSMWPNSCADDWQCSQTGPVSDIHFWGSFKHDVGQVNMFRLSIYKDIPDPDEQGPLYSMPGAFCWSSGDLQAGAWRERIYADNLPEQFWDPKHPEEFTSDTVCWQYNFDFTDPFTQTKGEIYWLEVIAWTDAGEWGWKTADPNLQPHFNDDAVWMDDEWNWQELRYPDDHPYHPESIDLAFVITPEPGTLVLLAMAGVSALFFVWRKRRTA